MNCIMKACLSDHMPKQHKHYNVNVCVYVFTCFEQCPAYKMMDRVGANN